MSELQKDNGEGYKLEISSSFLQMALHLLHLWVFPAYSRMEGGVIQGRKAFIYNIYFLKNTAL